VVEWLDAHSFVYLRLAISTNTSGDRILRDLVVTIIPQPLLQNEESPLDALQWDPFEYETSDRSYIILQARVKSEQLRRWVTGQEREATLLEFDPRPGRQSLALSFAMPALQETASAVRMPNGTPWGFEPLPWPSTTYECYPIPEPGRMPQDVSSTDAYEIPASPGATHASTRAARYLIYHSTDALHVERLVKEPLSKGMRLVGVELGSRMIRPRYDVELDISAGIAQRLVEVLTLPNAHSRVRVPMHDQERGSMARDIGRGIRPDSRASQLQQPRCRMRHRGCDCQVISCLATSGVHAPTGAHFAYEALERCTMTQP
jgi:hypothetical protein